MGSDVVELPGQQTLLACWSALAQLSPGAGVVRLEGAVAAVFPSWVPLNNAILSGGQGGRSAAFEASALSRVYDEAGVPVWALWRPSKSCDLDAADSLDELGSLSRDTTTLVMQASLAADFPPNHSVLPASIAAVAGFGSDVQLTVSDLGVREDIPGLSGWVLMHDGVVAAAAWSFVHEGDCGIYAVETSEQWRRHGFARSLMHHMLADAKELGAKTATLQSTRMGQPLYESLGFDPVGRYEEWISE